jgi:hypothetical protein
VIRILFHRYILGIEAIGKGRRKVQCIEQGKRKKVIQEAKKEKKKEKKKKNKKE